MSRARLFLLAASLVAVLFSATLRCAEQTEPQDDAVAKELQALDGTWTITACESDGRAVKAEDLKDIQRIVAAGKVTWQNKGETILEVSLKIDPAQTPKTVDSTFQTGDAKGKTMLGIYEIDGDTFRICAAPFGRPRPSQFSSPSGSGYLLYTAKRVQP